MPRALVNGRIAIDGFYDASKDEIILAGNDIIENGDACDFQLLLVGDLLGIVFLDTNYNNSWDNGEDIILDTNHDHYYGISN